MLFPLHAVCLPDVEWQPWSVCLGVCGHSLDAVCFPDAADVEWWSCLVCHNICLHSLDTVFQMLQMLSGGPVTSLSQYLPSFS